MAITYKINNSCLKSSNQLKIGQNTRNHNRKFLSGPFLKIFPNFGFLAHFRSKFSQNFEKGPNFDLK